MEKQDFIAAVFKVAAHSGLRIDIDRRGAQPDLV